MERLRAGEALLRSSQSFLPFLTPATYRSRAIARHCRGRFSNNSDPTSSPPSQRAFSTTLHRYEDGQGQSLSNTSATDDISKLLDDTLDYKKGTPATSASRPSTFKSREAQQQNSASQEDLRETTSSGRTMSSVNDLISAMGRKNPSPRRAQNNPLGLTSSDLRDAFATPMQEERVHEPFITPKNAGRTIRVDEAKGIDAGRALRQMESLCGRNQVRRQFNAQRFHERPGMKRKRLKRERWAKRFKRNFLATVNLVQKMKKQGW